MSDNTTAAAATTASNFSGRDFPAINLAEFDAATRLFPDSRLAEIYGLHAAAVDGSSEIPRNCNALVANLLLFHTDWRLRDNLEQPSAVEAQLGNAETMFRSGSSLLNGVPATISQNFVPSLVSMKTIFERCQIDLEPITINID